MNVVFKAVQNILVLSNRTFLKNVWKRLYDCILNLLIERLKQIPEIVYIGLTGSMALGKPLYWASDIDLIIVVDGSEDEIERANRRIWAKLKTFPFCLFVGKIKRIKEDKDFVEIVSRKSKEVVLPCLLKELYSKDDYTYPIEAISKNKELLGVAVNQQLSLFVDRFVKGRASLYLLRNKIRNLIIIYQKNNAKIDLDELKTLFSEKESVYEWFKSLMKIDSIKAYFLKITPDMYGNISAIFEVLIEEAYKNHGFPIDDEYTDLISSYKRLRDLCSEFDYSWKDFHLTDDFIDLSKLSEVKKQVTDISIVRNYVFKKIAIQFKSAEDVKVLSIVDFCKLDNVTVNRLKSNYLRVLEKDKHDLMDDFLDLKTVFYDFIRIYWLKKNEKNEEFKILKYEYMFDDLKREFFAIPELFEFLEGYYHIFKSDEILDKSHTFSPNLIPTAIDFFAHYLFDKPWTGVGQLNKKLSISLCICTKNRAEFLKETLDSVVAQNRQPDEVVIIDNNSSDNTKEITESFKDRLPLKYFFDTSNIIGGVRNRAIKESTGEIISFTDDDCVLHKNWLYFVEEGFLMDSNIGAVGGIVSHLSDGSDSMVNVFHEEYLGVRY